MWNMHRQYTNKLGLVIGQINDDIGAPSPGCGVIDLQWHGAITGITAAHTSKNELDVAEQGRQLSLTETAGNGVLVADQAGIDAIAEVSNTVGIQIFKGIHID